MVKIWVIFSIANKCLFFEDFIDMNSTSIPYLPKKQISGTSKFYLFFIYFIENFSYKATILEGGRLEYHPVN